MIMLFWVLSCIFAAIFGAAAMALFHMAKHTDIDNGVELSLEQTDKIVYMTNAEKLAQELDLMCDNTICNLIPYEHCEKYKDCDKCKADWLRMEAEK